ncbi:hypothetical protein SNS2_0364 [Streptomyces netropsis]|uniref:Membrane protein YgcG n=1 Tax=Streptomyces syringium TaxID=76729 RepID=A0ABS4XZ91_9ACTN|nr:hypothetical protein [Streptomyces syringium]MBP2401834.1 putative membrane protein YgcG [Streptomyces syringium]SPE48279.1 hypothetical protein SNS2_0364 [Streptomyces netropsis]
MTARHLLSPYGTLIGFVLLLAALFGVAYATGAAAGPVAPGMHRTDDGPGGAGGSGGSGGGSGHSGGMGGMHDMGAPALRVTR